MNLKVEKKWRSIAPSIHGGVWKPRLHVNGNWANELLRADPSSHSIPFQARSGIAGHKGHAVLLSQKQFEMIAGITSLSPLSPVYPDDLKHHLLRAACDRFINHPLRTGHFNRLNAGEIMFITWLGEMFTHHFINTSTCTFHGLNRSLLECEAIQTAFQKIKKAVCIKIRP